MRTRLDVRLSLVLLAAAAGTGTAQSSLSVCGRPPVASADARPNIFSEQAEQWLGEAEADSIEGEWRPIRDPGLSAHVQAIADRLAATLPPTSIPFRVTVVDSAEVNGFSIAGGHIYLTRKLAASAANDDELAGVIGHEIGHIASHQFAFEVTASLKRLLGVTAVGDRADVYAKYHALLDAEMKDKHRIREDEDGKQDEADRIGVYVTAAAGYRPDASAEFWDRAFFVKGKTGGRMSDLFGITKPDEKRLRELRALAAALPAGCGGTLTADTATFTKWRAAITANQAGAPGAQLPAVREVRLTPPLRIELDQLRFSPDGRSLLAQDESSIFVMGREPLATRYRIDANGALLANFSPDSQSITFSTPGMHTEQWSATENKLLAAHELLSPRHCWQTKLAPDGRTMLCVEMDTSTFRLGLAMLDTGTGEVKWEDKSWGTANYGLAMSYWVSQSTGGTVVGLPFSYSADNNTLLLGSGQAKRAFDLRVRSVVKTGTGVGTAVGGDYAFIGNDRLVFLNPYDSKHSTLLSFPEGKKLQSLSLPDLGLRSVTNSGSGLHALFFGARDFDAGLADVNSSKLLIALKSRALDEYDGVIATETNRGNVALDRLEDAGHKQQGVAQLPLSPLASLRAVALSRDGHYIAISTRYRGGVWDAVTGKQTNVLRGFSDAVWTANDTLYVDLPKQFEEPRQIVEISSTTQTQTTMGYKVDDETHMRYGRLTDWKLDAKRNTWALSMRDPASGAVVWHTEFPEKYFAYTSSLGSGDLLFTFDLQSKTAREALKADTKLMEQAGRTKNKERAQLIEVFRGETGVRAGAVVLEMPPSYRDVDGLNRVGDLLYVTGVDDRTTVYSLESGKQLRQLFGVVTAVDLETGRVCTANRSGAAVVYDAGGAELAHYRLGQPIRYAALMDHGAVLTLLTADQTLRTMDLPGAQAKTETGQAAGEIEARAQR